MTQTQLHRPTASPSGWFTFAARDPGRAVAGGAAAGAVPGEVVHTSLSTAEEKRLRDALAEGPAAVHWNT